MPISKHLHFWLDGTILPSRFYEGSTGGKTLIFLSVPESYSIPHTHNSKWLQLQHRFALCCAYVLVLSNIIELIEGTGSHTIRTQRHTNTWLWCWGVWTLHLSVSTGERAGLLDRLLQIRRQHSLKSVWGDTVLVLTAQREGWRTSHVM